MKNVETLCYRHVGKFVRVAESNKEGMHNLARRARKWELRVFVGNTADRGWATYQKSFSKSNLYLEYWAHAVYLPEDNP